MKTSEVFKKAKKILLLPGEIRRFGKEQFICLAIYVAVDADETISKQYEQIIKERLDGHYTLDSWLSAKHNIKIKNQTDENKIQETRHAWLDSLIAEFEAKGD